MLEFLVGQLDGSRILLIGTYHDVEVSRQHPLSQTLGNLVREQVFQRVQLAGLNRAEVAHFVEVASGVSPLPGLVEAVYARTEGNPLFVGEIIGMLPSDGLEEGRDYLTSIPEGVRDAIGQRLNRLSEGCNQVLTTASVVGREFDFRLLSALMDDFVDG